MNKILFEACVETIDSAITAEKVGAGRVELCSCLNIGGITPSYGFIKAALNKLTIPINVLIRPRDGNFIYSKEEFEVMKHDIVFCRENNINGIVFGILHPNFSIDKDRSYELIDIARPMTVTFNRAFDETTNPLEALDTLVDLKIDRLLTSGHAQDVYKGMETIKMFVEYAKDKIIIMPGGGINENNISEIVTKTKVKEIHGSARMVIPESNTNTFSKDKLTAMLKAINNI